MPRSAPDSDQARPDHEARAIPYENTIESADFRPHAGVKLVKKLVPTAIAQFGGTLGRADDVGEENRNEDMNTIGVTRTSLFGTALNLSKRNVMKWRRRAEDEIRSSGIDYTIVRVGHLNNRPAGQHAIVVSQEDLPLALKYRIARADVAEALVEALGHLVTRRATFDLVWGAGTGRKPWDKLFRELKPDS